jgi:protein-disulfide isomerase
VSLAARGGPDGGFRMGGERAPIHLVIYASLGCSHCARLDLGMREGIRPWLSSGRVLLDVRPYVFNVTDLTAQLVARCGGAARYFPVAHRLYETQAVWQGRIDPADPAIEEIAAMDRSRQLVELAKLMGIDRVALAAGVSRPQLDRCLADPRSAQALAGWTALASRRGVTATPAIYLNGRAFSTDRWPVLEAELNRVWAGLARRPAR